MFEKFSRVSRMDRGRNEEVRRRAGTENELVGSTVDQRVQYLDGLYTLKELKVDAGGCKWRAGTG